MRHSGEFGSASFRDELQQELLLALLLWGELAAALAYFMAS